MVSHGDWPSNPSKALCVNIWAIEPHISKRAGLANMREKRLHPFLFLQAKLDQHPVTLRCPQVSPQ